MCITDSPAYALLPLHEMPAPMSGTCLSAGLTFTLPRPARSESAKSAILPAS